MSALLRAAESGFDGNDCDDLDGPPVGWRAVSALHRIPDLATLHAARDLCHHSEPLKRRLGAAVLGQLGHSMPGFTPVFRDERFQALRCLLVTELGGERNTAVLADVCHALGHLNDRRAVRIVIGLLDHPASSVRRSVVSALSCHEDETAIDGLIRLTSDSEEDVRDWSTFALGREIDADTPAIRQALHARLDDPCRDAMEEAIAGLAKRNDRTVIPVLQRELRRAKGMLLYEAARDLADPCLCEALLVNRSDLVIELPHSDAFDLKSEWEEAMTACGCAFPVPF